MCTNNKLKTDCVLFSTLLHLTVDTEDIKNIHSDCAISMPEKKEDLSHNKKFLLMAFKGKN